jgi:hypothetical protein
MRHLYGEAQQNRTSLRCRPNRRIIIRRLLSSIEVGDAEAAREIVRLYLLRCRIERMFRARPPSGSVEAMTNSPPFSGPAPPTSACFRQPPSAASSSPRAQQESSIFERLQSADPSKPLDDHQKLSSTVAPVAPRRVALRAASMARRRTGMTRKPSSRFFVNSPMAVFKVQPLATSTTAASGWLRPVRHSVSPSRPLLAAKTDSSFPASCADHGQAEKLRRR